MDLARRIYNRELKVAADLELWGAVESVAAR